jgi:hypothetical protein
VTVGGRRIQWWGGEAEVSGKQDGRKASEHTERDCLVSEKAPKKASATFEGSVRYSDQQG